MLVLTLLLQFDQWQTYHLNILTNIAKYSTDICQRNVIFWWPSKLIILAHFETTCYGWATSVQGIFITPQQDSVMAIHTYSMFKLFLINCIIVRKIFDFWTKGFRHACIVYALLCGGGNMTLVFRWSLAFIRLFLLKNPIRVFPPRPL